MDYLILISIAAYITFWNQIRLFLSNLGQQEVFSDVTDEPVMNRVQEKTGYSIKRIRVLHSPKLFGMMVGLSGNPILILSSKLYQTFTPAQREYVIFHEVGHYHYGHSAREAVTHILSLSLGCVILWFVGIGILVIPLAVVVGSLNIIMARRSEYQADRYALSKLDSPEPMIQATRLFQAQYASEKVPGIIRVLFYRGVPYEKRIEMARNKIA